MHETRQTGKVGTTMATNGSRPKRTGALDVLLTEGATRGTARRVLQPSALTRLAASIARRPDRVARRAAGLGSELVDVARGRSELAPPKGDRRFADPAWQQNWLFRRV